MRNRISTLALFTVSLAAACGYDPHLKNGGLEGSGGAGGAMAVVEAGVEAAGPSDVAVDMPADVPALPSDSGIDANVGGNAGTGGARAGGGGAGTGGVVGAGGAFGLDALTATGGATPSYFNRKAHHAALY